MNLFIGHAYSSHPTIKFTAGISENETTFFNTTSCKGERFKSDLSLTFVHITSLLRLYAHFTSIHPTRRKIGFLREALRLLRTNSSDTTLEENLSNFKSPLQARLCPKNVIQATLLEVSFPNRQSALIQTQKSPQRNIAFYHNIPTISALY